MFKVNRIKYIKEKVVFLVRQLELTDEWVQKSTLSVSASEDEDDVKAKIKQDLDGYSTKINSLYTELSQITTRQELDEIPAEKQLEKAIYINNLFSVTTKYVVQLAQKHTAAKLDPFARETGRAVEDLSDEFIFILPNIHAEIERIRAYYKIPTNSERSVVSELDHLVYMVNRKKVQLDQFFTGFTIGDTTYRGYDELRTSDSLFSPYQYYENVQSTYDTANGSAYNICKALEVFMHEKKSDAEFLPLVERFEEVNRMSGTGKAKNRIESMSDIFNIYQLFKQIIKKMALKYSFKDEYRKAAKEFDSFNAIRETLIVYKMPAYNKSKSERLNSVADESFKQKILTIFESVEKNMEKRLLPFGKIESIFRQLSRNDLNIIVIEKDADDLTIPVTQQAIDTYGEPLLKKINMTIDEIDFWFYAQERVEKFDQLGEFTNKIQANESVDDDALNKTLASLSKELEEKFRVKYDGLIKSLVQVSALLEKTLLQKAEREKLNTILMEKDALSVYHPHLAMAKKNLIGVMTLLKEGGATGKSLSNSNKFTFIKPANEEICFILYELSMRLFALYPNVDRRSMNNLINILSLYREHHDAVVLWQSFGVIRKSKSVSNFDILEKQITMLTKDDIVKKKLEEMFPPN